jgi:hypothetical protein
MLKRLLAVCGAFWIPASGVQAETLLDETSVIVAPTAPSAVLREFDVIDAGTYELTVTDLAVPSALSNERAAVLRDGVIVKQLELGDAASMSVTFEATPGSYALTIVATPGAAGVGTIGARVRRGSDWPVLDLSEPISVPNPPPPATHQELDTTFVVSGAGQYVVTLADLGFPQSLAKAELAVVPEGDAIAATLAAPGQATFDANPGNYRLFVRADADLAAGAGVYFVEVRGIAGGPAIYRRMLPVGRVMELGGSLLSAGMHSLAGTDLELPAPLTALKLAVTSQGQMIARLDAPGTVDFTAAAAGHELLAVASPETGGSGSFAADLRHDGASVLSFVNTASDGSNAGAVTFTGTVPADGSYRLRLTDFAFPQGFAALRAVVTQNGATRASLAAPGTVDATLVAGKVNVLVFGLANQSGNGIYGVDLRPVSGTGSTVIEGTRGVGSAFGAWQFAVNTAGRYRVSAEDLEFPARFAGLDAVITRGPDVVGSFFGGGSFIFSGTPGTYFVNFIASPGPQAGGAGAFRVRVATAPNLPAITLTADPARVGSGGTTRLQWAATDATQCIASGAWSGSKSVSGNEATPALSTPSTFNLECTGPGGTSNTQLTVNVSAPNSPTGGDGGGGKLDELLLLALLAAVLRAGWLRRPHRHGAVVEL